MSLIYFLSQVDSVIIGSLHNIMEFNIWLSFFITGFLISLAPGPAVVLIVSQGLKYGVSTSNFGALGISFANLLFFILSAFGLGVLIVQASSFFEFIKIVGATYLVFIGIKMLWAGFIIITKKKLYQL